MRHFLQDHPEPERYELHQGTFYHFEVSRREFIATLGAGLVLSMSVPALHAQRAGRTGNRVSLAQRLHIGTDGTITILTTKVEIGQGGRTQLTMAAAEELHASLLKVRMLMGDTAGPDDGGTAGSRTTPAAVPTIRQACATARHILIETAARRFSVEAAKLSVRDGTVDGLPEGKSFSYASLASAENADVLVRESLWNIALSPQKEWQVLGHPTPRVNGQDIVTGAHKYPSDIRRPDMLYGRILRPPAYGATLTKIDLTTAKALPGVRVVHDGDFIGVAAPTSYAAEKALELLSHSAEWKTSSQPSSEDLYNYLRAHASERGRPEKKGAPDEEFAKAAKVIRQTYYVPYIQHAPMEPRAAVAEWNGEHLTVWTGSQQPGRVHQDLVQSLRIPADRVHVIIPDTGGGFGGKHTGETAVEAARLALAAKKPVSVRWSREEEFTWAYFRPAGVLDLASALDSNGGIQTWEHINYNSGASALATPYEIPNSAVEFKNCEQPLRSGSYRALAATANNFARESFMDELAEAAGADPLDFRLRHITNERLRAVLAAAADRFAWKKQWKRSTDKQRHGIGLACGTEKGSYMACCVQVEVDEPNGTFRVVKVVEAFECGGIQNPSNLKAQVEGCIIQGLGGALTETVEFKEGRILNGKFSRYSVPRFKDVPEIETVLIDRPDLASVGAGETPIIGIAPAIGNALNNAVQVRLRSLPLRTEDLQAV